MCSMPASWPPYPYMDFPVLRAEHLRDARLYAERADLITGLALPPGPTVGEVGVGLGNFSEFMLKTLHPKKFVAFDTFELHDLPVLWGQQTAELFGGMTHRAYYEQRLAVWRHFLAIEEGPSQDTLARYPEKSFDLIYVDADHRYDAIQRDAALAGNLMKRNGVLIFNDYTMLDHLTGGVHGVVPVVNQLIVNEGWRVIGFSLQQHMFCDIALRK
jgi:Methyltransferase domain